MPCSRPQGETTTPKSAVHQGADTQPVPRPSAAATIERETFLLTRSDATTCELAQREPSDGVAGGCATRAYPSPRGLSRQP
ncbi:MAG: hypothetical protein ACKOGA_23750, partial [Planctomycetaceae bacterium]